MTSPPKDSMRPSESSSRAPSTKSRKAPAHAARLGQAGRHAAAHRRGGPEMRRLEGQHLTVGGQLGLQIGQRRAGAHRDDEFGRVIVDDAAIRRHVQQAMPILRRDGPVVAIERFAAAAHDEQGLVAGARRHDLVAQLRQDEIHTGYVPEAGEIGKAQLSPCTCILPYSAQRASVGMTFSGLSRHGGSNARLTARNASSSSRENCTHI